MNGAKRWYFADGYLDIGKGNNRTSHESLCILNANEEEANIKLQVFFSDKEPISFTLKVPPMRDIHVRMDLLGLPYETPYGIKIESDITVVSQLSRMSINDEGFSLMTTTGCWENDNE